MKTQRAQNQNRRSRFRDENSNGRFNEDRNASYDRYHRNNYNNYRDTEGESAGWDRDFETEGRTYSRDHDNTYSDDNSRYENQGRGYIGRSYSSGGYNGNSDRDYEDRNSGRNNYYDNQNRGFDYDRSANYDYDENEFSENPDRNYGGSSYGTSRDENYGYERNTGRQGPNRTYPPYGTDRNYGSGRNRDFDHETTDREDARNSYGNGSRYGTRETTGNRSRSYSSRGSRNNQY